MQVDARRPAELVAEQSRDLHPQEERRAQDGAVNQSVNAHPVGGQLHRSDLVSAHRRQDQDSEQGTEVVHTGRQGRQEKVLVRLQPGDS